MESKHRPRGAPKNERNELSLSPDELNQLSSFLAAEGRDAAQREAMLSDIDALYSQLIRAGAEPDPLDSLELEPLEPLEPLQLEPMQDPVQEPLETEKPVEKPPSLPETEPTAQVSQRNECEGLDSGDGEELLTAIGQLYSQMMQDGAARPEIDPDTTSESKEVSHSSPKPNESDKTPSSEASSDDGELSSLLEETWQCSLLPPTSSKKLLGGGHRYYLEAIATSNNRALFVWRCSRN